MKFSDCHIDNERKADRVSQQVWLCVTAANEYGIEIFESKTTGQIRVNFPLDEDGGYSSKTFETWIAVSNYIAGFHSGHCAARGVRPGGPTNCGEEGESCKGCESCPATKLETYWAHVDSLERSFELAVDPKFVARLGEDAVRDMLREHIQDIAGPDVKIRYQGFEEDEPCKG